MDIDDLNESELKELAEIQQKQRDAEDNCAAEKRDYGNHISDYTKRRYDKAKLALEVAYHDEVEFWDRIGDSAHH